MTELDDILNKPVTLTLVDPRCGNLVGKIWWPQCPKVGDIVMGWKIATITQIGDNATANVKPIIEIEPRTRVP
jgi:hypothetical protein